MLFSFFFTVTCFFLLNCDPVEFVFVPLLTKEISIHQPSSFKIITIDETGRIVSTRNEVFKELTSGVEVLMHHGPVFEALLEGKKMPCNAYEYINGYLVLGKVEKIGRASCRERVCLAV